MKLIIHKKHTIFGKIYQIQFQIFFRLIKNLVFVPRRQGVTVEKEGFSFAAVASLLLSVLILPYWDP